MKLTSAFFCLFIVSLAHASYTLTVTTINGTVQLDPSGGTYEAGTVVRLIPRPSPGYCFTSWSGDLVSKRLVGCVTMNGDKSITAGFGTWHAPIGIPDPNFGITENYHWYDDPNHRNGILTYTHNAEGGYFTHYVDSSAAAATDTSNPYGSVAKPRKSIPRNLPAGSVVEVHHNCAANANGSYLYLTGQGTVEQPIYVRGYDMARCTLETKVGYPEATCYIIVEGMYFHQVSIRSPTSTFNTHHAVVRNCELMGEPTAPRTSSSLAVSGTAPNTTYDTVVYGNLVHDFGQWDPNLATGDMDYGPLSVNARSYRTWVLDNTVYHVESAGIIASGNVEFSDTVERFNYIGRNVSHHNKQDGIWTKTSADTIFSQNAVFGHFGSSSSSGSGMGMQYSPKRVWFLFNESFDNDHGLTTGSPFSTETREDIYFIGNLIYDCTTSGFNINGINPATPVLVANNNIVRCPDGIRNSYYASTVSILNNIIANYTHAIKFTSANLTYQRSGMDYNLLDGSGNIVWNSTYTNLAVFQAGTVQGDHCIEADPSFVSPTDFRLRLNSPAMNAAQIDGAIGDALGRFEQLYGMDIRKDMEGLGRPQGDRWDIGAYEYAGDSGVQAVSDLHVSQGATTQNSVTISWTVPGQEGGTTKPVSYDFRYSTNALTETTWATATQVPGEPAPGTAGTSQSLTITGLTAGTTYYFAIKSVDAGAYTSALSNVVSVTTAAPDNHAPQFQAIEDQSVVEGGTLTFAVSATDADGDALSYSAKDLPPQASFTAATRTFTWTPGSGQVGPHSVTFEASDGKAIASKAVTITVSVVPNHAPVLAAIGNQSTTERVQLQFAINATDAEGDPLTYTATGLPAGATFADRVFTWTPSVGQAGSHQVAFAASDGKSSNSETVTITVIAIPNTAPVLAAIGDRSTIEESQLQFPISGTDAEGDSLTYAATGLPAGATFADQVFAWTPGAGQAGSYQVTFTVSDGRLTDAETMTLTVIARDRTAPAVAQCSPAAGNIQAALNTLVCLDITDSGSGVDANSVVIRVNDAVVYQGNVSICTSANGRCSRSGTEADYRFFYQSDQAFDFDQLMTVSVDAADRVGNVMSRVSYSFTTEMRAFGKNQLASALDAYADSTPVTACGPDGTLWLVWEDLARSRRKVYLAKLSPGSAAFSAPVRVSSGSADQRNPRIAITDSGDVYIVWQDNRNGNWDIYASVRSGGRNVAREVRVTRSRRNETNPAIAVGHESPAHLYIAWQDNRNGNEDIYAAVSTNALVTVTETRVTSNASGQTDPAVGVDGSNVAYVFWTDARSGQTDIYGAACTGSFAGFTWANVPIVTGAGNQSEPVVAVAADSTTLHLLWGDDAGGNKDICYAALNGLPGSPVTGVDVSDDTSNADQVAPALACGAEGKIFACWQDFRHADAAGTDTDLYATELRSGKAGTNIFVGDDETGSSQSEPAMSVDRLGQPYLVWTDFRNSTTEIYYAGTTLVNAGAIASQLIVASVGGTVGTDPAAIDGAGDVSIVVPAGACPVDMRVSISPILNPPISATALLGGYDFGPSGVEFAVPVTVTIPYITTANSDSARPYWYDSITAGLSQQGITDVRNITISSTLNALQFRTTHFTPYYVVGGTVNAASGDGSGGGGGCALAPNRNSGRPVDYLLPFIGVATTMAILRRRDRKARLCMNRV